MSCYRACTRVPSLILWIALNLTEYFITPIIQPTLRVGVRGGGGLRLSPLPSGTYAPPGGPVRHPHAMPFGMC